MDGLSHWAIFITNRSEKADLLNRLLGVHPPEVFSFLAGKKGALFSKIELDRFIEEEVRHDRKVLTAHTSQGLQTMSSGERKKALLDYLLKGNPDFLVLDNPFDNLDTASQDTLKSILKDRAAGTILVFLISRMNDLLPFINNYGYLDGSDLKVMNSANELQAISKQAVPDFEVEIPTALTPVHFDGNPLIAFKKVSVSYDGKPVLKDIDWEIKAGEFWQLAGRNGSGKTTLLSMITGDNPKGYGQELYVFGNRKGSGESVWDIKKKLGYFTPAMIDRFRGYHSLQNMLISGFTDSIGLYVQPTEAQIRIARAWLRLLGMEASGDSYFHDMSMGVKRLVMCARAMIKHPLLLILDEPTAGLDDASARLFVALVNKIGRESRSAILFVSHRDEPGLTPDATYQLEMTDDGSKGTAAYSG